VLAETQTDLMKKGLRQAEFRVLARDPETQTDLMKKGLRPRDDDMCCYATRNTDRPDEEGIKTNRASLLRRSKETQTDLMKKGLRPMLGSLLLSVVKHRQT